MKTKAIAIISLFLVCMLSGAALAQGTVSIPNCVSVVFDTSGGQVCGACRAGYAPAANRLSCNACANGCSSCQGSVTVCTGCFSGYSLYSNSCYRCPSNCQTCRSDNVCSDCRTSNYMSSPGYCSSCLTGCYSCTDSRECLSCESGYEKVYSGGVNICKTSAGSIVGMLIFLLCCVGIIMCIFWTCFRRCVGSSLHTTHYVQDHRSSFIDMGPSYGHHQPAYNTHVQVTPPMYGNGGYGGGYGGGYNPHMHTTVHAPVMVVDTPIYHHEPVVEVHDHFDLGYDTGYDAGYSGGGGVEIEVDIGGGGGFDMQDVVYDS